MLCMHGGKKLSFRTDSRERYNMSVIGRVWSVDETYAKEPGQGVPSLLGR